MCPDYQCMTASRPDNRFDTGRGWGWGLGWGLGWHYPTNNSYKSTDSSLTSLSTLEIPSFYMSRVST